MKMFVNLILDFNGAAFWRGAVLQRLKIPIKMILIYS